MKIRGLFNRLSKNLFLGVLLIIILTAIIGTSFVWQGTSENNHNISPHNFVLTLIADKNEALLNGELVALSATPFIQNDIFYIPLKEITIMLGGKYSFKNNIATIELFNNTTKYQIGSRSLIVNGETYEVSVLNRNCSASNDSLTVDENFVPLILEGTVYIPVNFTADYCPNIIAAVREYPGAKMVILGGFENERGVNEVKIRDDYDNLPEDIKSQLNYAGVIGEVINYSIEEYKNDDLEVYVMRINESYEDMDDMDGRVCAIHVVGDRYSTPRGLKTGDSEDRIWLLYGDERFLGFFFYKANDRTIKSFTFCTNYFGSNLNK